MNNKSVYSIQSKNSFRNKYNHFFWILYCHKKAEDEFPEEAIEPTLKELSENLKKGSRSGSKVKIKIRKLDKIAKDISKPVIIGETEKTFKMN